MKEIAELKEIIGSKIEELQNKIKNIQNELDIYKKTLTYIDSILEKESFKTAAELIQVESKEIKEEPSSVKPNEPIVNEEFEIKSDEGTLLGKMIVEKNTISITPTQNITISKNDAPFKTFFLGRILKQMEEEDLEAIKNGNLHKDQLITYEVVYSPNNGVQNITINNYHTYNRMIKILDTISWTFRTILKSK